MMRTSHLNMSQHKIGHLVPLVLPNKLTYPILNITVCCTPKFALSILKASLTMILKIQACTSTLGFSSTRIKRKLSKREKTNQNDILTNLEENRSPSIQPPSIRLCTSFDFSKVAASVPLSSGHVTSNRSSSIHKEMIFIQASIEFLFPFETVSFDSGMSFASGSKGILLVFFNSKSR